MIRSERCKVGVIKSFGRFRSNQPVKQKTEFSDDSEMRIGKVKKADQD